MMEKGEILLPESIIQYIQSRVDEKEGAQTTILSKSWHAAWKTRPKLCFDQRHFMTNSGDRDGENKFWKIVEKTVQRYEKLNLKIESFSLLMNTSSSYSLANNLILKVLKLGVVDLEFSNNYHLHWLFELPHEAFESENLTRLSLKGCKIGLGANAKINRIKSLCLDNVLLEGDIIWDIIQRCPLIEKLSLCSCRIYVSVTNVPFIEFGKRNVVSPNVIEMLKCLSLHEVIVDTSFFKGFSSKFPCLKDLGLHDCYGYKVIRISSPSLEFISITHGEKLQMKFNVPSILKFTFSSGHIPSLSFVTGSTINWESDISITCHPPHPTTLWFCKLNRLLTRLSLSRVSLSLKILCWNMSTYPEDIPGLGNRGLPKPVVENLSVDVSSSACPNLFECLLRCCCPIFVTQFLVPKSSIGGERNMGFLEVVYKSLIGEVIYLGGKFCQDALEEVRVEVYNEAVSGWQAMPWKSVLDADEHTIRFHLIWGRDPVPVMLYS